MRLVGGQGADLGLRPLRAFRNVRASAGDADPDDFCRISGLSSFFHFSPTAPSMQASLRPFGRLYQTSRVNALLELTPAKLAPVLPDDVVRDVDRVAARRDDDAARALLHGDVDRRDLDRELQVQILVVGGRIDEQRHAEPDLPVVRQDQARQLRLRLLVGPAVTGAGFRRDSAVCDASTKSSTPIVSSGSVGDWQPQQHRRRTDRQYSSSSGSATSSLPHPVAASASRLQASSSECRADGELERCAPAGTCRGRCSRRRSAGTARRSPAA